MSEAKRLEGFDFRTFHMEDESLVRYVYIFVLQNV